MTAPTVDQEAKYAAKIAKLLNQAESVTGPEADAFMQMAAMWMAKYAIDEQMIAAARGLSIDELVQDQFDYSGIYRNGHQKVGAAAAEHFGLKLVYGHDSYKKPIVKPLYLAGFKSDVERARILDTSLQLQCAVAHRKWWSENQAAYSWMDKGLSFRTRRDFVFGFAQGVRGKLSVARREAQAEAAKSQAERVGDSVADATTSVALVLVSRKEKVSEYYDEVWGGKTRNVNHNYGNGAGNGRESGYSAGRSANTNTSAGVTGGGKAIGR